MTNFVIITAARSGSNYLMSLLNSHPNINVVGEVFSVTCSIEPNLKYKFNLDDLLINDRFLSPSKILDKIYNNQGEKLEAIGFKLFYEHGEPSGSRNSIWESLKKIENLKIIHLMRKDLLLRKISLDRAFKTNNWLLERPKNSFRTKLFHYIKHLVNNRKIKLDIEYCEKDFKKMEANFLHTKTFFADFSTFEIYYEDLLLDRDNILLKLQDFLNVPNMQLFSPLKKQNTKSACRCLTNYDELKNHFANTKWACFFKKD